MDFLVLAANASCGFEHWCPGLAYNVPLAKTGFPPGLLAALSKAGICVLMIAGAIVTIRQKRKKPAHLARRIDSHALAEKLAKAARLSAAPWLTDAQVDVLAYTIEILHVVAEGRPEMREAIAMLHEGKFGGVEQVFAKMGKTSAAPGTQTAKRAGEAFRHLGNIAVLYDIAMAIQAYETATELNPKDTAALFSLGQLQTQVGNLDAATRSFEQMLVLGDGARRQNIIAAAAGSLGSILQTRGDLGAAEVMYRRALAVNEKLGHGEGMASQYGSLGLIRRDIGDLAGAEAMHQKSLALFEELDFKPGIAAQYGDLGTVYRMRGDLDQAEAMYKQSLNISEAAGLTGFSANQYANLGGLYMQRGDRMQACANWRKASDLFGSLGMRPEMAQVELLLSTGGAPSIH